MATAMVSRDVIRHNTTVLNDLETGDLVEFKRGVYYSHWAVYVGHKKVVHLAGMGNDGLNANVNSGHIFTICGVDFNKAVVKEDNFWSVTGESKAYKNNGKDRKLQPDEIAVIVERALSKLGQIGYNVLWKNCEHFASWCRYGSGWSEQANSVIGWTAVAAIAGAIIGGIFFSSEKKEKENTQSSETSETRKGPVINLTG